MNVFGRKYSGLEGIRAQLHFAHSPKLQHNQVKGGVCVCVCVCVCVSDVHWGQMEEM